MKKRTLLLAGATLGLIVAMPVSVMAAQHVKPGLWEITIQTKGAGMPDMSQLPPEAQAQMKAMGIKMSGNGMTTRSCVTPQEAAADPKWGEDKNCKVSNMKWNGQTYSADIVCKGGQNGHGHITATLLSPDHYTATTSMTVIQDGQSTTMDSAIEAKLVSTDCGKVK
jgi:hypothetical protein